MRPYGLYKLDFLWWRYSINTNAIQKAIASSLSTLVFSSKNWRCNLENKDDTLLSIGFFNRFKLVGLTNDLGYYVLEEYWKELKSVI